MWEREETKKNKKKKKKQVTNTWRCTCGMRQKSVEGKGTLQLSMEHISYLLSLLALHCLRLEWRDWKRVFTRSRGHPNDAPRERIPS